MKSFLSVSIILLIFSSCTSSNSLDKIIAETDSSRKSLHFMSVDELHLDSTVRKSKDSFEAWELSNPTSEMLKPSGKAQPLYPCLIRYYSDRLPVNGVTKQKVLSFKEKPQQLVLIKEVDIYSKNVSERANVNLVLTHEYPDNWTWLRTDSLPTERLQQINRELLDSLEKKYPGIKTDPCGNTVVSILEENYPEPHGLLDTARAKYWIDKFTKR